MHKSRTDTSDWVATPGYEAETLGTPSMVDVFSGPKAPLASAFRMCGWQTEALDREIRASDDLNITARQQKLAIQMKSATFVAVAFDCSTKSRVREIPREFEDGRRAPGPLRSEDHPEGLPSLQGAEKKRVEQDNTVTDFVLELLKDHDAKGGGSMRENPNRSLHWWLQKEQEMIDSGRWADKRYAACVLQGARCKQQRIRHNIEEFDEWPPMNCHHIHESNEWEPQMSEGIKYWPSKEEAEYTAALAFYVAVSASWWAMRRGYAKMRVPRLPQIESTGDKRPWLRVHPKAFREWAMIPTALGLGIKPPWAGGIPARISIEELDFRIKTTRGKPAELPAEHVYIGQGHHSHRLIRNKWASPFLPGIHGTASDCVGFYLDHIRKQGLVDQIQELQGMTLVCDCRPGEPCTGDALAAEFYASQVEDNEQKTVAKNWRKKSKTMPTRSNIRTITMAAAGASLFGQSMAMRIPKPQEAIVAAFCSLYPSETFEHFKFPMIEDLVNQSPFTAYMEWREEKDLEYDGPLGPALASQRDASWARSSMGKQLGAISHKAALPQLIAFQQSPDEHFKQALRVGGNPTPTELAAANDEDLEFAAHVMCKKREELEEYREKALAAMKELKHRWRSVTTRIRKMQPKSVWQVTRTRDAGMIGLLVILLHWPDVSYAYHMLVGFPAVGYAPWCQVFSAKPAQRVELSYVLEGGAEKAIEIINRMRPGADDDFITEKSEEDCSKGWSTPPMSWDELLSATQHRGCRLIRRFAITQSSGKKRVIDDAADGGQSETSEDANKLRLCNALQPAHHLTILRQELAKQRKSLPDDELIHTGTEDWPDAYRLTPMDPDDAEACVVTYWHAQRQEPVFQIYSGMLFGLPLAVTAFNRYPKFCEAVVRRYLAVMYTMYFDDATLQDWASLGGSGQRAVRQLMKILGTPFAEAKQQDLSTNVTFLGLDHDTSQALSCGKVHFWVRQQLEDKLMGMITEARVSEKFGSGAAAKLFGTANFFEGGSFGKIGRSGLNAVKERQYSHEKGITADLANSFTVIETVVKLRPERVVHLLPPIVERYVGASDAAYEDDVGTGGFLLAMLNSRGGYQGVGRVVKIEPNLYHMWEPCVTYIAQLELVMILIAVLKLPDEMRGKRGIWFIDNTAALMALIRGRSNSPDLDKLAGSIHAALFAMQIWMYFEWVESKSNWADGISREALEDEWYQRHGFVSSTCTFPSAVLGLPLRPTILLFQFM